MELSSDLSFIDTTDKIYILCSYGLLTTVIIIIVILERVIKQNILWKNSNKKSLSQRKNSANSPTSPKTSILSRWLGKKQDSRSKLFVNPQMLFTVPNPSATGGVTLLSCLHGESRNGGLMCVATVHYTAWIVPMQYITTKKTLISWIFYRVRP